MKLLGALATAGIVMATGCNSPSPTGIAQPSATGDAAWLAITPTTATVTGRVFQLSASPDRPPAVVPYAKITVRRGVNQVLVAQANADASGYFTVRNLVPDANYSIKATSGTGKSVTWYGGLAAGTRNLVLYIPWY